MKIFLNYKKGNPRLKEGLELSGCEVLEDAGNIDNIISQDILAGVFEFKYIFKDMREFLLMAYKFKKRRIPIVTWNLDSPWNGGIKRWKVRFLLRSSILSLYAAHSLQDTDAAKNTSILYLPNAAWTSRYNLCGAELEDLRRHDIYKWDVSFIGNIDKERYYEHRKRADFLEELGRYLNENKIRFLFIDSRELPFDRQVEIIQRSKINLSCMAAADSLGEPSWGLPERCYGIPACGGFLLMEDRCHAKDNFIVGKEAAVYSNLEDCRNKIMFYLERHEERREIAERAYQRVMNEHTYKHRAQKLISEICRLRGNVNYRAF